MRAAPACLLLLGALLTCSAAAQDAPLPDVAVYPADPARPVKILASKTYTAADMAPGGTPPPAVVALLPAAAATRRVYYIVDYAAYSDNANPGNAGDVVATMTLTACLPGTSACTYPHELELRNSQRRETVKRTAAKVNGASTTLLSHRETSSVEIEAGASRELRISLSAPPIVRGVRVRVTVLEGGEYSFEKTSPLLVQRHWARQQVAGPFTIPLMLCAMVVFGALGTARYARSGLPEDAPRALGSLIALFGLLYAWAPFMMAGATPPSLYGVIAGLGWLASGMYLALGRRAGRHWYMLTLAFIWIWSLTEAGGKPDATFVARIGLPTLLALVVGSRRTAERLD